MLGYLCRLEGTRLRPCKIGGRFRPFTTFLTWGPLVPHTVPHRPTSSFEGRSMNDECLTYSIPEAGKLLGYSRNTAYEAASRGQLPTIRLGRKIRIPKVALQRLLEGVPPKGA